MADGVVDIIARWSELYEPPKKAGAGGKGPLKFVQLRVHPHVWTVDYRRLHQKVGEEHLATALGVFAKCLEMAGGEDRGGHRNGTIYNDRHGPANAAQIAEENGFPFRQVEFCLDCLVEAGWVTKVAQPARKDQPGESPPLTANAGSGGKRRETAGNGGKRRETAGNGGKRREVPASSRLNRNRTEPEQNKNKNITGTGAIESRRQDRAGPVEQLNRLESHLARFDGDTQKWVAGFLLTMAEETQIGREYTVQQDALRAEAEWLMSRPDRNRLGARWIQIARDKIAWITRNRGTPKAKERPNNPWAMWQSTVKNERRKLEAIEVNEGVGVG